MGAPRPTPTVTFGPASRASLVEHPDARFVRKKARTVVRQIDSDFVVHTSQGIVFGRAGDWLATNHPDDDPSSDVWPISNERFVQSYEGLDS